MEVELPTASEAAEALRDAFDPNTPADQISGTSMKLLAACKGDPKLVPVKNVVEHLRSAIQSPSHREAATKIEGGRPKGLGACLLVRYNQKRSGNIGLLSERARSHVWTAT